jgi:hypothetical protein
METAKRLRERADQAHRLGAAMTTPGDKERLLNFARELSAQADVAEADESLRAPGGS